MKNTAYQNAMRQISADDAEIRRQAQAIQAQFDARHPVRIKKRGFRLGVAAAAAVVLCGTVTVGAANGWNYASIFTKYFSEKAGNEVVFDFTGMGMDIGQTVAGEGYDLTVQSVVADTNAVYVVYDIALHDDIRAKIERYGDAQITGGLSALVMQDGAEGTFSPSVHGMNAIDLGNGVYRNLLHLKMDCGTDLSGKQLELTTQNYPVYIGYDYSEDGRNKSMKLWTLDSTEDAKMGRAFTSEPFMICDLSGIAIQEGKSAPYGGTLPNDGNDNVFETMNVTPFQIQFLHEETIISYEAAPKWGTICQIDPRYEAAQNVAYTAVYADGTEITLQEAEGSSSAGSRRTRNEDGSYHAKLDYRMLLASPISMDGLTAIRIGETEIPLTPQ